ncbi:Complement C1q-like protein 4 [Anabarilius grahami]|uniref:Complement C1q-like protein 4 n=1 Tax=Anabarilius grahami TaxID=495550 RepID=A0A3N0Z7L2_ANAGA|nr:Complement C1q-like protein 4 [Anabarilius grahami]
MKVSVALLLLCSLSLSDGQTEVKGLVANGENNQHNIWTEVRDLRDMLVEQRVKLDMAMKENARMNERMKIGETQLNAFKREHAEQPKVAFSADLGIRGNLGPQRTEITLTFNNVFTNIGNNYNPTTGLFTAPVKGVYYFRFTACGVQINQSLGASLYKNGQKIVSVGQWHNHDQHRFASNGAVLQLEVDDVVCMKLLPGYTIYDSPDNLSTFSGFLIYPL